MYQQISKCTDKTPKKHYWGGGGGLTPCPLPPLAIVNMRRHVLNRIVTQCTFSRSSDWLMHSELGYFAL